MGQWLIANNISNYMRKTSILLVILICSIMFEYVQAGDIKPKFSIEVGENVQVCSSPVIADVDRSYPGLEIIIGTWDGSDRLNPKGKMYVIHQDGTIAKGWPVEMQTQIGSSPAVGDIDNDGDLEIVVGSRKKRAGLYAWHHDGTSLIGWPYLTNVNMNGDFQEYGSTWVACSPTLVDIDKDGDLEIVFATTLGMVYILHHDDKDGDGKPDNFEGWPIILNTDWIDSSPAVADIDEDGDLEIVIADWNGNVNVFNINGEKEYGWPKEVGGDFYSSPAIADIDPEYAGLEIVISSKNGSDDDTAKMYVWHCDGTLVSGWPISFGEDETVLSSPGVGDINNDGQLEILIASQAGVIYAYKANGDKLWSYETKSEINSSPALGDVDGDGDVEIVIGVMSILEGEMVSEKGYLCILNHNGTVNDKWNIMDNGGDGIYSSPALADIDKDKVLEVIFGSLGGETWNSKEQKVVNSYQGGVFCYKLGRLKSAKNLLWPMFRHDMYHLGVLDSRPPTIPVVTDEGSYTYKKDQLYASWVASDNGSGIIEYKYRITQDSKNGKTIKSWTSVGGRYNYVTAGGLSLNNGKTYYFNVKAKDRLGLWSNVGYSDGIKVISKTVVKKHSTKTGR